MKGNDKHNCSQNEEEERAANLGHLTFGNATATVLWMQDADLDERDSAQRVTHSDTGGNRYVQLSKLAQKYLNIKGISRCSDWIFSSAHDEKKESHLSKITSHVFLAFYLVRPSAPQSVLLSLLHFF